MRRGLGFLIVSMLAIATLLALATPALAMLPKFHDELNLKNDRHTVAAGGPCNWEAGDAWADIKDVTVTQGSVAASSNGSTTVRKDRDRDWWLDVSSSSQFTRGPALVSAVAVVHRTDGTTYEYAWSDSVQLH
jgi:hypothetical protein